MLARPLVAAVPALVAVLFWRSLNDAFTLPKATLVVAAALLVVALGGLAVARGGNELRLREPRFAALVAAFGAVLLGTALVSDHPMLAFVGQRFRFAGVALYLGCAVLALAVVQLFDRARLRWIAWGFLGAGAVVAGYAALQIHGTDPLDVPITEAAVVSTMGNSNFVVGWLAVALPLALWAALTKAHRDELALLGGAVTLGTVYVLYEAGPFQGMVAGAAGVAVVLATWVVDRGWHRGRGRIVVGAAALVLLAGLVAATPFIRRELDNGLLDRRLFWEAAVDDIADAPVLGHGADSFSNRWYRLAADLSRPCPGGTGNAGAAHDVPLDMGIAGGLPLLALYLAVVGYTGTRLVAGLRSTSGETRLLVAGIGGAWVAYQVQSLVSLDVPALAVAHWVLAGAVLVAAGRRPGDVGRRVPRWTGVVVVVLALAALVPATRPLRAELHLAEALRLDSIDEPAAAVAQLRTATRTAPWASIYHSFLSARLDREGAAAAAIRAAELAPGDPFLALDAARAAEDAGDAAAARRWRAEADRVDPCMVAPRQR